MEVLDHERWSWFLLASDGELLFNSVVSHGPFTTSLLIALDDDERAALAREGRPYLSRLAEDIQMSVPLREDAGSPYRPRDLTRTRNDEVTRAVVAWREAGGEGP